MATSTESIQNAINETLNNAEQLGGKKTKSGSAYFDNQNKARKEVVKLIDDGKIKVNNKGIEVSATISELVKTKYEVVNDDGSKDWDKTFNNFIKNIKTPAGIKEYQTTYNKVYKDIQEKKKNAERKPKKEKKEKKVRDPNAPKREPNEFMKNSIEARKFVVSMIEKGQLNGVEAGFKLSGIISKYVKANYIVEKEDGKTDWTASFKKFKNDMKNAAAQKSFVAFYNKSK